ncbi:hypothetical protein [Streptomyces sp. YS-3]|uniref:hypothetical protein n=1 Tax=Streptomyces sp. YS-3 TaxID=3381352 RepID=UPI00386242A5
MAATPAAGTSTTAAQHHVKYSDADIVGLLVFAKGRAADEHKGLAQQIRAHRSAQSEKATLDEIAQFTRQLKAVDADFHDKVTVPVQVQDPFQAKEGMERLNSDITKFMVQNKAEAKDGDAHANGWVWHDANVLIEINAVGAINALAYANVGAATEVAVALVVVPSAVSYGFDMSQPNSLDADNTVAAVAAGL